MPGTVQRDGVTNLLWRQFRFCLILVERRIQLCSKLSDLDFQQQSIRCGKARYWQAVNPLMKNLTQSLSFRLVFHHVRHECILHLAEAVFKPAAGTLKGREKAWTAKAPELSPTPVLSFRAEWLKRFWPDADNK